jgi:outer membrane protein TolC
MIGWLALFALIPLAHAERPLTYDEALRAAVEHNPSLATARLARLQAQGSLLGSRGQFDPTYVLDGRWEQRRSQGFFQGFPFTSRSESWNVGNELSGTAATGTTYSLNADLDRNYSEFVTQFGIGGEQEQIQDAYTSNLGVSVTQQLLEGILYRYNLQNVTRAQQSLTTAELQERKALQDALYTAAEAYWSWVYADELRRIADESVEVAAEALRVGKLQVESGQLAPVEGTRLEAALVQAQQQAIDAANTAEQAANTLLVAIGEGPDQPIRPATPPGDVPPVELDEAAVIEVALAQNVDLAVARATLETARIDERMAKHAMLPTLSATGAAGVAAQDTTGSAAISGLLDSDNQPYVSIGGRFEVPLGNRSARGERDRTMSLVNQRERELENLERTVTAQVEEQVRALQSARRSMELADINVRLAEQTLAAEEALAEAGRNIQKDVLEARTELDRSRAEAAKARTDYRLAQAQLLRLQGQLDQQVP